jgi:hypothetical protein
LKAQGSRFEIVAPDWRLSFQRRVGAGVGSNRGALPCYRLNGRKGTWRFLIPVLAGEALWLAWMVKPGVTVSAADANGIPLHIARVTQPPEGWSLFAIDELEHPDGRCSLDADAFAIARTRTAIAQDHLRLEVRREDGATLQHIGIALATPALYARVSGQPAPSPSTPGEAYTGWRLP